MSVQGGRSAAAPDAEHVIVYYDAAVFAAWPFSHGLWTFPGGDVLIGFSRGASAYDAPREVVHKVVNTERGEFVTLRSTDGGRTWPRETLTSLGTHHSLEAALILRDDGGSHDLGYPRIVQRSDGKVLAAYYFNHTGDSVQCDGGVRHIAATIFTP